MASLGEALDQDIIAGGWRMADLHAAEKLRTQRGFGRRGLSACPEW